MKYIQLNKGQVAIVDDEDFEYLDRFTWHATQDRKGNFYANSASHGIPGARTRISAMHRIIMKCPKGMQVDHKNHFTLDNRKENLRICTSRQNQFNKSPILKGRSKSKYLGVDYNGYSWLSQITVNRKKIHLGSFNTEEEAARAYDIAARFHFGEFSNPNFT